MDVRVVLIESEYEINLGYIARTMKNFGAEELMLMNPGIEPGYKARMFAKHGVSLLDNARRAKNWEEAVEGCDIVVGTTARGNKTTIALEEARESLGGIKGKIALVIGRDGSGLKQEELNKCDMTFTITASRKYPSLNISHALAIILYELKGKRKIGRKEVDGGKKEALLSLYSQLIDLVQKTEKPLRNAKKVHHCFKRVLGRAVVTDEEAGALSILVKRVLEELDESR